jgi:predicted nucleic acid-binding protein
MIVLDTNVLSELTKISPAKEVLGWMALQPAYRIFTTAITQAEMLYGIELLPEGKRRSALLAAVQQTLRREFADRILPFDSDAAVSCGWIRASRQARGRPISEADALIAAIAHSRGAALATRNTADFEHCGIKVVSPWSPPST